MAGKKINQLTPISVLSDESVLPIVYVENGTADSTATKVTIEQLKEEIGVDAYTKQEADAKLAEKQNKLTAGENIVITEDSDETVISAITSSEYTAGTGIDIESDEISIDDTVYTQDNLIAGTNIEIEEELNVPDENTMMLLHFNNSVIDSANEVTPTWSGSSPVYTDGKFDRALASSDTGYPLYYNSSVYATKMSQASALTIDFWCKKVSVNSDSVSGMFYFGSPAFQWGFASEDRFWLRICPVSSGLAGRYDISDIEDGEWFHVALVYNSTAARLFINGSIKNEIQGNYSSFSSLSSTSWDFRYAPDLGGVDELRISNVARWTSNFVPPTSAYGGGEPTGRYLINNTQIVPAMTGATSGAAGKSGLVPAPSAGDQSKYLTGAGTWQTVNALQNTATGLNSLTILGTANTYTNSTNIGSSSVVYNSYTTAIGMSATCYGSDSTAIGTVAQTNGQGAIAIGYNSKANAQNAIQIGTGTNSTASSVQIGSYQVFDRSTGKIPMARLPIVQCTQAEYDALVDAGTIDSNSLYLIIPGSN